MCENVIEIRNLSRRFRQTLALDNVDLEVPKGVVLGLVGENGAGKTTLIRHVLGLLKAKTGGVLVFGRNPVTDPVGVLGRIGHLSEDRDLPGWMRVAELMRYMQAFYPNWDEAFAEELRQRFELYAYAKVKTLSRGRRALCGLLIALAHRPELLVLDEPSSGLDPVVRRDILGAIIRTTSEEGRTVLFSSHLIDEVERVAERVAMIHNGRLVLSDNVETVLQAHRTLTLRFPGPLMEPPQLEGALSCNGAGREWTCLTNGEIESFRQAALAQGAEIIEEEAASLEEIFVSRVHGGKQKV